MDTYNSFKGHNDTDTSFTIISTADLPGLAMRQKNKGYYALLDFAEKERENKKLTDL